MNILADKNRRKGDTSGQSKVRRAISPGSGMNDGREGMKKIKFWDLALLCISIGFYLLYPLLDGPVWCADSGGYVSMHITREPLYPTFLALCRGMAGVLRVDALMITVVLQSVLAGFTAWYAGIAIRDMKAGSRVLQLAAILFQFAVTLLCRFAAGRGSAYTDSILTEGVGLSFYVLFIISLYLYVRTRRSRQLWLTLLFSFLLISLRKQMMITLLIMGIVFAWYILIRERQIRKFLCLAAMIAAVLIAGKVFDRTYQYAVRGEWMEHSGNSMGILCTLLYSSDVEKDQTLFENETVRELYLEIMRQADAQQLLYKYAGSGWLTVSGHYADSYDAIGYGIINPVVEGYIQENFEYSETETARQYDAVCGEMTRTLMRQSHMPLFKVYVYNLWKGLVNSIAQANRLLSLYAAAAYLTAGAMAWYLARRGSALQRRIRSVPDKGSMQEEESVQAVSGEIGASLCFAFIVMTGIVVNALAVGIVIFAQPRYMIYSMGLFYTAVCMMGYDILRLQKHMYRPVY